MASPARGIALGAAARAFRESDKLGLQREAITSRENIAEGIQQGQSERQRVKIEADEIKETIERGEAAFQDTLSGLSELQAKITSDPSPAAQASLTKHLNAFDAGIEHIATNFEKIGKPLRAAQIRREYKERKRAPGLGSVFAESEGTASGTKAVAAEAAGETEVAARKAGAIKKAEEAVKTPTPTSGEKKISLVRELAKEMNRVDKALRETPDDPVLQAEKRLLEDEFDQDTIGKVLVPIVRKVLEKGEKALTPNEQAALNVIRNTSGLQILLQKAFGDDLSAAPPTVTPPPASTLDFDKLSKPMQELVGQAKDALKNNKDPEAVRKAFLEQGGSEQVFSQFVLGQ